MEEEIELKSIKKLSLAKMGAFAGFIFGLITGALSFTIILLLSGVLAMALPSEGNFLLSPTFPLIFCVIIVVIYTLSGALFGFSCALTYNLLARVVGGVKLKVKKKEAVK